MIEKWIQNTFLLNIEPTKAILCVCNIQLASVLNVHKPPPSALTALSLLSMTAPAIYAGDFNCKNTDWGYKHTTQDSIMLSDWASSAEALLLFDPKEPPSFLSACWNAFAGTAVMTCSLRDTSLTGSLAHTTDCPSSKCHCW